MRRWAVQSKLLRRPSEQLDELFVNDLDHLLAWRQRARHLFAQRLVLDACQELLDDTEVNVGLEQRQSEITRYFCEARLVDLDDAAELTQRSL